MLSLSGLCKISSPGFLFSGFAWAEWAKQPFFAGASQCQRNMGMIRSNQAHGPPSSSS